MKTTDLTQRHRVAKNGRAEIGAKSRLQVGAPELSADLKSALRSPVTRRAKIHSQEGNERTCRLNGGALGPYGSLFLKTFAILLLGVFALNSFGQTPVLFPLAQMTGTTNDTTITIRPVINPVKFHSQIYWLPTAGIQLATENGSATTNLIPNDYNVTIAGVPGSWKISVSDTNIPLNAAEIGNLTVYSANGPLPGVTKIREGNNITISPPSGMGVVTINSTGGGGATNGYQTQAGNRLISIATNLTDLIYTISGVSQTNGYPWGVLYDAAGTAQVATNGISIASGLAAFRRTNTFDSAGAASAATNGYPWSSLFDAAGSATAATNGWPWGTLYDSAGAAQAVTNGYPWGVLYDAAGSAMAATNGWPWGVLYDPAGAAHSATNGYPWAPLFDATGSATAATNGLSIASGLAAFRGTNTFDAAGSASAVTNGYAWGVLYDAVGSATAATNGWPWGVLYDAAGSATAATNGLSLASGLAAFRSTNTFAATNAATTSIRGLVKPDGSTITITSDGIISATTGGGGSVTSVGLSMPQEFSVSNSPVTVSGTLTVTRTGTADFLGFGATNVGFLKVTNTASIGGAVTVSALIVTNSFTNQALTASTLLEADANKKLTSIANGIGALTNDASGNFGYAPLLDASALKTNQYVATDGSTNLVSTQNGNNWTNTIGWADEGTATNITAAFNGTLQTFTVTNGPTVFLSYAGANGSVSYRIISTNSTALHFSYQPKWLTGSNSVITNGVLSLTSYGGTNATQIEAAIKENQ
jgi:hypothetical protein